VVLVVDSGVPGQLSRWFSNALLFPVHYPERDDETVSKYKENGGKHEGQEAFDGPFNHGQVTQHDGGKANAENDEIFATKRKTLLSSNSAPGGLLLTNGLCHCSGSP